MSTAAKKPSGPTSPIAERIRGIAAERGLSPRGLSLALGWDPSQLGVILRRMDAGGNVRSDTLAELAKGLGRSQHWLLTGEEGHEGTLLEDLPGWAEAAAEARTRYRISAETIAQVARWRVPRAPAMIDAAFVVALARALDDALGAVGRTPPK